MGHYVMVCVVTFAMDGGKAAFYGSKIYCLSIESGSSMAWMRRCVTSVIPALRGAGWTVDDTLKIWRDMHLNMLCSTPVLGRLGAIPEIVAVGREPIVMLGRIDQSRGQTSASYSSFAGKPMHVDKVKNQNLIPSLVAHRSPTVLLTRTSFTG